MTPGTDAELVDLFLCTKVKRFNLKDSKQKGSK